MAIATAAPAQTQTQTTYREAIRAALRQRKSEEAFQDWVRQIRDKAFVEIRLDER